MKKILLLCCVICCLCLVHNARAQSVLYSGYSPFDMRSSNFSVVGKINGKLYTFHSYNNEYFLDAYNDSMDRLATVVLDFFPAKIYRTRFITFETQMLVLYEVVNGTRITQYAALLDDMGKLVKGPLKVDEMRTGFWGATNRDYFASAVSPDKNHVVVYGINLKGKQLEFEGFWIDRQQLKIIKRKKTVFKGDNILERGDALLTNDGELYLPVYSQIGSRDFSDEYLLLSMKKDDLSFTVIKLPLNDNYLEYPYQKLDNLNNKIYIGAFYSSKKNGNNEGVLYASYDITAKSFSVNKLIPFDESLREATGTRNKQRALNDFKINQLIVKNDGGFVLAAEEIYVTTRTNYTPGWGFYSIYYTPFMSQSVREYHYNDILVLSCNNDGAFEWNSFIRKEQYSQEDGGLFSSYVLLNTGGGLGFLFNDFNTRRSRIQLVGADADGKLNTNFLDAGGNDDPDWIPRSGKQVDSREIVIPCLRKRQICFAKIVL